MYAVKDNRTTYLDRLIDLGSDVCARNNVGFSSIYFILFNSEFFINHRRRQDGKKIL